MSEPSALISDVSADSRLPGSRKRLLVGALCVLFAGYLLGSVPRPEGVAAFPPALVAGLAFVAMLFGIVKVAPRPRHRFAGRAEKPIGQFVDEAKKAGVSLRVAREAYDLLRHHYPRPTCVGLNDELRRDLRMSPADVLSVRAGLLGRTDRLQQPDYAGRLTTVRQLLNSVEAAPRNGIDRAQTRQRITDLPLDSRPVVENLEFTEKSALSDPDFLRRAHFKWVRRRDADYQGFRSRESDQAMGKSHVGPFRRSTELSRRLAIRQEAGRLAKEAAALEQRGRSPLRDEQCPTAERAEYHGY